MERSKGKWQLKDDIDICACCGKQFDLTFRDKKLIGQWKLER